MGAVVARRTKNPVRTVTRCKLALALGKNVRTIADYIVRGMPREKDGLFSLARCKQWIAENVKPTGRADAVDELPAEQTRRHWEMYRVRELALTAELERKRREGELIGVDDAARFHERIATTAKTLFEQIPARAVGVLPKGVPPAERKAFERRLEEMINDALESMAQEAERAIEDGFGDEDTTA